MNPGSLRSLVAARVPPGDVVVALSGGADSAVLAWALADRPAVRAITIDHGLPASAGLAAAAERVAAAVGLSLQVVAVAPRDDSEDALRSARLDALLLHAGHSAWIATGHTADDQAETVLGNLLRGAGAGGLAGIPAKRGRFIRPLLDVSRADTRRIAGELGLAFADDPTNEDVSIRRNRLRMVTLPALAADYNPALTDALVRTGRLASADDALLEERAARVPVRRDEEAVLIPAAALRTLPSAVAARVVRRALRMLDGPHAGVSRSVEAVILVGRGGHAGGLPGGLVAVREGPFVAIVSSPPAPVAPVTLDAVSPVRFGPWSLIPGAGIPVPASPGAQVRCARPGDRLPTSAGSQRVVEVLRAAGIPPRLRARWPVVTERGRIAWVVGVRAAPVAGAEVMRLVAIREAG